MALIHAGIKFKFDGILGDTSKNIFIWWAIRQFAGIQIKISAFAIVNFTRLIRVRHQYIPIRNLHHVTVFGA